jgi:hypothetical protein
MEDIVVTVQLSALRMALELYVNPDLTPDPSYGGEGYAGAMLLNWDNKFVADNPSWIFECTKKQFKEEFNRIMPYQKGLWAEVKALRAKAKQLKLVK